MSGARQEHSKPVELARGAAIQVQPGTGLWQAGARFGEVIALRHKPHEAALVRLDTGKRDWLDLSLILEA